MDCNQPLQVFFGTNIRCLLDLSGEVEVIPRDDAVSCGVFGTFMQIDPSSDQCMHYIDGAYNEIELEGLPVAAR